MVKQGKFIRQIGREFVEERDQVAIIKIEVPIVVQAGKVISQAQCTIEVDTSKGEVKDSNFHMVLRDTFAKHLREMADIIEAEGIQAVQGTEFNFPELGESSG